MTTTTGTTSTASSTVTPTTTSGSSTSATATAVSSAATTLLNSLGTGSGIDTTSLVTSLVDAQYAAKSDALKSQADTLTSQISGVANLKNAITTFNTALQTLVKGGSLQSQPTSSNGAVLSATALPGAKLSRLSSSITVSQLAAAQVAVTRASVPDRTAAIGSGTLTLTLGTATYAADGATMTGFTAGAAAAVTIDVTNGSLDDIAAAINGKNAGVTAAVVTDADGSAYLSLKGATGKAQAFTLAATSDPSGQLAQLAVGPGAMGTRLTSVAQNAKLTVDGVAVERATNTVSDLIDGVKLSLTATSTLPVTLGASQPTDALSGAVTDFVDTYNQVLAMVKEQTDPITGVLRNDSGAQQLLRQLQGLTLAKVLPGAATDTPSTLAEIGVATNRDGTLQVDSDTLTKALTTWPDSVEAMFGYSSDNSTGLSATLNALTTTVISPLYGLGASSINYQVKQTDVSEQQDDLATAKDAANTRLTQQFSSMNAKVASYKSIGTFLTNQIAAWNKSDS